jgi:hypothetical protein
MVHNGIEYGLMAAYAEGLNVLKHANAGKVSRDADAETAPTDGEARERCSWMRRHRRLPARGTAAWPGRLPWRP